MQEIWRDIPNYEGLYQVSNLGTVKSLERKVRNGIGTYRIVKQKILKAGKHTFGYYQVNLSKNNKTKMYTIHKLVAIAFLNHNINNRKIVVDHINNICTDNRVENLQLISQRENSSKDKKNGTSKYTGVSFSKRHKKWKSVIKINGINKNLGSFSTEEKASLYYQKALKSIKNGTKIQVKKPKYTSEYKGVYYSKSNNKWVSSILLKDKRIHLGYFKTEHEAYIYYKNALESIKKGQEIIIKKLKQSSKYKGVVWAKRESKWISRIWINGKNKHLGFYKTEHEAHLAYQEALKNIKR